MFWICFAIGLTLGGVIGIIAWARVEGVKGVFVGIAVTILFALVFAGGITLDEKGRDSKWNGGYCPNCEVHWIPYGVSDTDLGSRTKYYYCPECFKEIQR